MRQRVVYWNAQRSASTPQSRTPPARERTSASASDGERASRVRSLVRANGVTMRDERNAPLVLGPGDVGALLAPLGPPAPPPLWTFVDTPLAPAPRAMAVLVGTVTRLRSDRLVRALALRCGDPRHG